MKVYFSQIYLEGENTTFPITNTIIHLLSIQLDKLNKNLNHYEKLFKTDDFSIIFVISATRKSETLNVKGPTTKSKDKETYFLYLYHIGSLVFLPFKYLMFLII